MRYAAWRGIGRAASHGAIRSMLERFSFSSALPSFRYANARSERQNFGDGGTAEGNCSNIQRIAPRSVDFQMARHTGATTLASLLFLQPFS